MMIEIRWSVWFNKKKEMIQFPVYRFGLVSNRRSRKGGVVELYYDTMCLILNGPVTSDGYQPPMSGI